MPTPFQPGDNLPTSSKKSYVILSLCFVAFGAAIAILTSLINYQLQFSNIDEEVQRRFVIERKNKVEDLSQTVQSLEVIVRALAENPLTQAFIDDPNSATRTAAKHLFLASAHSHRGFMQVRFIDANGFERIRVDRSKDGQQVDVVADDKMQNKRNRYYFTETAQLPARQFWHSKLDLNVENGEIERPVRPTYRVSTPIFSNNQFAGMVIINAEAEQMLSQLVYSNDFDIFLIDGDGEILFHRDAALAWSRYLPGKESFKRVMPDVAAEILVSPNAAVGNVQSFSIDEYYRSGERLQVVMIPKLEAVEQLQSGNMTAATVIAAIVVLISFPLSWLAAMFPARLQSELRSALDALHRTNEVLDRYVISSTTNTDGVITNVSSAFSEKCGYALWELEGKSHNVVRHPETPESRYQDLWGTIRSGKTWRGELHNRKKSGEDFWIDSVISPEYDADGQLTGYTQISQDINDRKAIEKLLVTDVLTQVHNRRKLDEVLATEMERFKRYQQTFSVIILDLDHFKQVNDNFGHQAGDAVLTRVAELMKETVRKADCVGRWGGEEFMVVSAGTTLNGAASLAEKLRQQLLSLGFDYPIKVTASFGVAQCQVGEALNQLIKRADQALYHAKETGRNRVVSAQEDS
ncbi:sensor domain-containing diguanylate cyclase [Corallincola spongiicola]|uniref:diguanylate cyclase n=1 Tax=Corallincola spongiicola TaxID=2520508 RepID=A0ABY1WMN6_9GAMM|nr:diguanylate cyclase [Corallincola spongiicola]TAA43681.1 diguanylate cyclase [Corallincola spongiicola]